MYSMLPTAIACALHGLAFRRAGLTLTLTNAGMMTNASFPTEGKGDSTLRSISHGGRGGEGRATDSQREKHAIGPPARALKRSTAVALRSCDSPRKADPCVPKCKTICPIQLATSNLLAAGDMQTHLIKRQRQRAANKASAQSVRENLLARSTLGVRAVCRPPAPARPHLDLDQLATSVRSSVEYIV